MGFGEEENMVVAFWSFKPDIAVEHQMEMLNKLVKIKIWILKKEIDAEEAVYEDKRRTYKYEGET